MIKIRFCKICCFYPGNYGLIYDPSSMMIVIFLQVKTFWKWSAQKLWRNICCISANNLN